MVERDIRECALLLLDNSVSGSRLRPGKRAVGMLLCMSDVSEQGSLVIQNAIKAGLIN